MICPNCQKENKPGIFCRYCHVDMVVFSGVEYISNKLYNQGLARLKVGDFYHGTKILEKSILVNRDNIPARNLLGLALFEVGHIGEALKHWNISCIIQPGNNPAKRYLSSLIEHRSELERLNSTAMMFNKALAHIKQKSTDLAIIQLRKTVEANPKFIDAHNLLTFCYLVRGDRENALSIAEKVLAFDNLNPNALNYYRTINPTKKPRQGISTTLGFLT